MPPDLATLSGAELLALALSRLLEEQKEREQAKLRPNAQGQPERLLLVDEVADLLRMEKESVYELARRGLLPSVPRGKRGVAWRPSTVASYQRTQEGRR